MGKPGSVKSGILYTTTESTVGDSTISQALLQANPNRYHVVIRNSSTARMYIALGATAATTSPYYLDQDDIFELPVMADSEVYRGIISAVWASGAGGSAYIQETV